MDDVHTRLSLLPAYPSFDQATATNLQDHLLLTNVSRMFKIQNTFNTYVFFSYLYFLRSMAN